VLQSEIVATDEPSRHSRHAGDGGRHYDGGGGGPGGLCGGMMGGLFGRRQSSNLLAVFTDCLFAVEHRCGDPGRNAAASAPSCEQQFGQMAV
jgi:hypothetical protein